MYKYINEKNEHLHTLDTAPLIGTSTVVGILAKNLTWWSAECAAVECLESGEKIETIRGEYLVACSSLDKKKAIDELQKKYPIFKKARFAHFADKNKKAELGVDRHEILERYVKLMISDQGGVPHKMNGGYEEIDSFISWAVENVKRFLWSELHCYSKDMWTGGIADVGWEDMHGQIIAGDFKSSKEAFLNQFIQVAGYDLEITENGGFDKDGNKIFTLEKPIVGYCIVPFGSETLQPKIIYDIEDYKLGFKSALVLHRLQTQYEK